jgi:hypothetical protein
MFVGVLENVGVPVSALLYVGYCAGRHTRVDTTPASEVRVGNRRVATVPCSANT